MNKNKIYKHYKDMYTEKQMDEILEGEGDSWCMGEKRKKSKKDLKL